MHKLRIAIQLALMSEATPAVPTIQPFRPCRKCHRHRGEHLADGKCLYGPTRYEPIRGRDFKQDWVDLLYREWESSPP